MSASGADRRRTPHYEGKRARLSPALRLELELVEERILSEKQHPYAYRMPDGSVFDLTAYRETGIAVLYLPAADGNHLFVDFVVVP